ncbi:MAG: stage II sporulation protein M [Desulfotomaculaceae bacterium]|nr:stage II sporulation protein M [Desulfotomaculaceae bacterium]MDD4767235.1 stage II sporulation protein M [Desulfotomaculaceae bacterium]
MILLYRILDAKLLSIRKRSCSSARLFLLSLAVFVVAVLVGGLLGPVIALPAYDLLLKPAIGGVNVMAEAMGGSGAAVAASIFIKNITAVLITIALARRTRGISVAILLLLNGLIIGSILNLLRMNGYAVKWLAAGIMTHGVFELTGLFLAGALGLKLVLLPAEQMTQYKKGLRLVITAVLIPIFLVAAYVEAFITPAVLK